MRLANILSLALVLLVRCDYGKSTYSSYEYVNNTSYTITMRIYNNYKKIGLVDSIFLQKKGGSWESTEFDNLRGTEEVFTVLNTDSVAVIFDNTKVISYTNSINYGNDRDLVNRANYELIIISSSRDKRRFTFTNEDYNNAEEIGGG